MEVKRLDADAFDRVARQLGPAHVFQSAAWARVRERAGWRAHFFGVAGSEEWDAALLCLEKRKYGVSMLQVARGPILREGAHRPLALEAALKALRSLARRRLAAYAKASPDLALAETWASAVFRAVGARPAVKPTGHTATFRLDLVPSEDQLLARMESRTRHAIRKAAEAGVEVKGGVDHGLLQDFYDLYRQTCGRAGIGSVPMDQSQAMLETGIARVYVAYHQQQPVSGALTLRNGATSWYLLGGSRRGVKHTGAELLQWAAIREAKASGITTYDLQGIPRIPDKADPLYGVYLFKRGLGGARVDLLGEFDLGSPPFMAGLGARALSTISALRATADHERSDRNSSVPR